MKLSDLLKEEHTAIKLMLRILDKVCGHLKSGKEIEPEYLTQILEFIRIFADKCHHGKEEEVLFPALETAGIPREGGPIGVMLIEHNQGRDYVRGMSEAVAQYQAGARQASSQIVKNAQGYITLLQQHIEKEENILYPMAEIHLSGRKQKEILEEFERVETERIGAGKHEEFHQLLHRLEETYLK